MFRRLLKSRFVRKVLLPLAFLGLGTVVIGSGVFLIVAGRAQTDFRPVQMPMAAEHSALIDRTPNYRRPESATYLTFPEWYLVFNPQEYAQFLHQKPPSDFPYFKSIGQFWGSYAQVYGITRRHYPFNYGYNLMVVVIGTSSTVEYVIKGVYENTLGRVSEWTGSGARTPEDAYAAQVAQEYGDFIPTEPWFDFPFGHKLAGLWTTTGFFGPHFIRKCERKFFLSLEYGVKSLYAGVIRLASHAVYGVADTEVYVTVKNIPDRAFVNPAVKRIMPLSDGSWLITVPHYQGFTDTVPSLAGLGVEFEDIAGNDEILLTIITPAAWNYDLSDGRPLFAMEILANSGLKRIAIQAPVKSLGRMLREIELKQLKVEHLFDY